MNKVREVDYSGQNIPSEASLPTNFGLFKIRVFHEEATGAPLLASHLRGVKDM